MFRRRKREQSVKYVQDTISSPIFENLHKVSLHDFTRKRNLWFTHVLMIILRKSVKSLQLILNELFIEGELKKPITASAYTQARKKFKHTAFLELTDGITNIFYADNDFKTWKNFRCIAGDGSVVILPNTQELGKEFGYTKVKNEMGDCQPYVSAMFLAFYDPFNRMVVKSILAPSNSYEVNLATQMISGFSETDLLIFDRGFVSYEFFATLLSKNLNFVIRCSKQSFKAIQPLFQDVGNWSQIITLDVPRDQKGKIKQLGLPEQITLRFVSVILPTGEVEVLATTLIDETITREEFSALYYQRWGVEGFFNVLKGRLALENFTGKSVEAIKQDFWATIFISNLETIMTEPTQEKTNNKNLNAPNKSTINRAVSFNAIKNMVFDIFLNPDQTQSALEKLELIFATNTIYERPPRNPPRRPLSKSLRKRYNFLKRSKKQVF